MVAGEKGPTEIRTQVARFKVWCDNQLHYRTTHFSLGCLINFINVMVFQTGDGDHFIIVDHDWQKVAKRPMAGLRLPSMTSLNSSISAYMPYT